MCIVEEVHCPFLECLSLLYAVSLSCSCIPLYLNKVNLASPHVSELSFCMHGFTWNLTVSRRLTWYSCPYCGNHTNMMGTEWLYHCRKRRRKHSTMGFWRPETVNKCMLHSMSLQVKGTAFSIFTSHIYSYFQDFLDEKVFNGFSGLSSGKKAWFLHKI